MYERHVMLLKIRARTLPACQEVPLQSCTPLTGSTTCLCVGAFWSHRHKPYSPLLWEELFHSHSAYTAGSLLLPAELLV